MILTAAEATVGVVAALAGIAVVVYAVVFIVVAIWRVENFFKE